MSEQILQSARNRVNKLPTGIPGFDDIASGGVPLGRSTLVAGTAGSCKTIVATQFLVSGIRNYDESGVMVTFEESPTDIRLNAMSFGWDLQQYEEEARFAFVDASPDPGRKVVLTKGYDFSALLARIEHAARKVGAKRVAIDSINSIFSQFVDSGWVRGELLRIIEGMKRLGLTAVITTERNIDYGELTRYGVEEFVTDNVVILRNLLENQKRRRTIEILKFRGTNHQKGEFPFTITEKGAAVVSLTALELTQSSSDDRISMGNKDIDEMCGGGLFRDAMVLLSGATGTGKTLLSSTYIAEGCKSREKGLIFAYEESAEQLRRNASGWGLDFHTWEERDLLRVVCAYPESLGVEDHLLRIKHEIDTFKPDRVSVDSLSAIERVFNPKTFREFIISVTSLLKSRGISAVFTSTTEALLGGMTLTESNISSITDAILILRYAELMGEMQRGIAVLKMRGSDHDKSIRRYEIDSHGIHVGRAFQDVAGILAGNATKLVIGEEQKLSKMFER
jgi:circadian clock protein KaiC